MENNHLRISVAIATYNRVDFLPGLFASLMNQSLEKSAFEVIIIDNNCTDGTEAVCMDYIKSHPEMKMKYVKEANQGLSYGRNRGIAEAKAEYITFADDDALLSTDFLQRAVDYLDKNPEVGEVGGPIFLHYMEARPRWANHYIESLFGYFNPSSEVQVLSNKKGAYPRGSNMTFRTELLREIGGFNVQLGRTKEGLVGGEEKDIAYRLMDKGVRIDYSPEIVVAHLVPKRRTEMDFIRRQAIGVGRGERIRSLHAHEYPKRLLMEGMKWGATFILFVYYCCSLRPSKGIILFRFRYWITCGLVQQ